MSENIFKNIEGNFNNNYCLSENIRVFPCAYRGYYSSKGTSSEGTGTKVFKVFDPEARSTTEANFTNTFHKLSNNKESYVVAWVPDSNTSAGNTGTLKCVIGGYYFEISNYKIEDFFYTEGDEPKSYHLCIKTADTELGTDKADGGRKTPILSSFAETENYLDVLLSDTKDTKDIYIFTGLTLKKSTTEGDVTASLVPFIAHCTYEIDGSVSEENKQIGKYYLGSENNYIKINTGDSIEIGTITYKKTISYEVDPSTLPITSLLDTDTGRYSIRRIEDSTSQGTNTTIASGDYSIALGKSTTASGEVSTALGNNTEASGNFSLVGGSNSEANEANSFAFGSNVKTNAENQVVFGKNNTEDENQLFILANDGNKFTVSYKGNIKALGNLELKGDIKATGNAANNLELGSPAENSYGTITVYGSGAESVFDLDANGNTNISGLTHISKDTESNSSTSGAFKVDGGVGIKKNLYVGGSTTNLNEKLIIKKNPSEEESNVKIEGTLTITETLNISNNSTNALNVTGGIAARNISASGNISTSGDITVTGNISASRDITVAGNVSASGEINESSVDTILTTKKYVDNEITDMKTTLEADTRSQINNLTNNEIIEVTVNSSDYIYNVTQANGKISPQKASFITNISNNKENNYSAPTTKAVNNFVEAYVKDI